MGLSPEATAELVARLAESGVDFVKDDELMADPPHSRFDDRVAAVMRVVNEHAERTGKKIMYAFNVSDELDAMLGHYQTAVEAGGTAVMVSVNSVGLAGVKKLCDQGTLPVHGHRNGWGMLNRHPLLGIDFRAYQKLWRLAGVDHLHVNGLGNKFWKSDDSVVRSIAACGEPFPPRLASQLRHRDLPVRAQGGEESRSAKPNDSTGFSVVGGSGTHHNDET